MTTAKEARDLRDRIYELHLRGLAGREISGIVHVHESQVSRHLAVMRLQNEKWYDDFKEPNGRARSIFKEQLDRIDRLIRRAEIEWERAVNPTPPAQPTSVQNRIGLLNTMISLLAERRIILGLRGLTMDEVYYREQILELRKAVYEKRQAEKVTPIVASQ